MKSMIILQSGNERTEVLMLFSEKAEFELQKEMKKTLHFISGRERLSLNVTASR